MTALAAATLCVVMWETVVGLLTFSSTPC